MIYGGEMVDKIIAGEKTETRRIKKSEEIECKYVPGRSYAVQPGRGRHEVARIKILSAHSELLGEISEAGARREGFASRSELLRYWTILHGGLDLSVEVWVICFELLTPAATECVNSKFVKEFDVMAFDDAVYERAEQLGGLREQMQLVIDRDVRAGIAKLQLSADVHRQMSTWQGLDLIELRESRGGHWEVRRKA